MSIGILITFVLWGAGIALALWPVRRYRALAFVSFMLSIVINELPQIPAILILTSVVLAFTQGDVSRIGVVIVLVLTALLFAGLLAIAARGVRTQPTMVQALAQLNIDTPQPTVGRVLLTLLRPFPVRPMSVKRIGNVPYGPHPRQRLDVFHHRSEPARAPVLVYFHGGGYFSGGKRREGQAMLHRFATRGWVCISANYRLRPRSGFDDHLHDAKRVIAWAHAQTARFGADPTRLVVSGSSAGAHLTAISAQSQNDPELQPGFEGSDTSMSAAVCFCGYYGRYYGRSVFESPASTPHAYDATNSPPFMVIHGAQDTNLPVEDAREFVGHLRGASTQPVIYAELAGAQHNFDRFRSIRYEAVIDGVEAFLARLLSEDNAQREHGS